MNRSEPVKCPDCLSLYNTDHGPHVCTSEGLKANIKTMREGMDGLAKYMATQYAWSFTLDDDVSVKVEFHGIRSIAAKHIQAFSKIFSSVAEHYVTRRDEEAKGEKDYQEKEP